MWQARKRGARGIATEQASKRVRKAYDGELPTTSFQGSSAKFCRFTLYKENMDTGVALGLLARLLHCNPSVLNTAGTKDRRAVTVQHVTAFKVWAKPKVEVCQRVHWGTGSLVAC